MTLFVILPFYGHCIVCPPISIYGFWLPLWYLQFVLIYIFVLRVLLQNSNKICGVQYKFSIIGNRGCGSLLQFYKQFLLHLWHPSCYKPSDNTGMKCIARFLLDCSRDHVFFLLDEISNIGFPTHRNFKVQVSRCIQIQS
jgi:hypothetical protein